MNTFYSVLAVLAVLMIIKGFGPDVIRLFRGTRVENSHPRRQTEERVGLRAIEVLATTLIVVAVPVFGAFATWAITKQTNPQNPTTLAWMWGGVLVAYLCFGIKTVQQGEVGALKLFGRAVKDLMPGICWAPLFVGKIVKLSSNQVLFILGAQTDKTGKVIPPNLTDVDEDKTAVLHDDRQFFVTFASAKDAINTVVEEDGTDSPDPSWERDDNDPLNERIVTSPQIVGLFRINSLSDFLQAFGDMWSAYRNIYALTEGALSTYAGRRTLAFAIAHAENAAWVIQKKVEGLIGDPDSRNGDEIVSSGVDLVELTVKSFGTSYSLNQMMESARTARYTKEATITKGTGDAEAVRLMKNAEADGRRALLDAEADGRAKLVAQMKTPEGKRLAELQTMAEAIKAGKVVILGGGGGGIESLLGLIPAGKEVLKATDEPTETPPAEKLEKPADKPEDKTKGRGKK